MGRSKSELKSRDKYAELYACVLVSEAVVDYGLDGSDPILKIEIEEEGGWDDVVQKYETGQCRHQIKKQMTDIDSGEFSKYVKSICSDGTNQYHFAVPAPISVKDVGELRILQELCRRVRHPTANFDEIANNLRKAEIKWVGSLKEWTKEDTPVVFERIRCLYIDFISFEEDLKARAVRALKFEFGGNASHAFDEICKYVSELDGVVDIKAEDVRKSLPDPELKGSEALYWSLIQHAETRLWLSHWWSNSELLMSNVMRQDFCDDINQFCMKVSTIVWPATCESIESAIKNLSARVLEYREHFLKRCTAAKLGNLFVEDKSYKQEGFSQRYLEEVERSNEWHEGNQKRLFNLVVALNELFDQVRAELDPEYRLKEGKIGIYDEVGAFQPKAEAVYYPDSYISLN